MARDNKTLGMFRLDGIPPAPRGVPQIEVTFDIDANGIVHVSAKDLGTGKETNITITSSTNMSKDDINKAVQEAEQYAEQDKKAREEVENRNAADSAAYQAEKMIDDLGDKISADDKSEVQAKIAALRSAISANSQDEMKAKREELEKKIYEISSKIYSQQGGQNPGDGQVPPAGGGYDGGYNAGYGGGYDQPQDNGGNDDNVVDADYREVD